jgi:predicted nucleotidyltransferase
MVQLKGIKAYNHKDRAKILESLIPQIKKKFGKNLISIATQGSFARNEDLKYSDIEIIVFLENIPEPLKGFDGIRKIKDGLLVEINWTTKKAYIQHFVEPNPIWYISGADVLEPIFNKKFVDSLKNYKIKNFKNKCLQYAFVHFSEYQEYTSKVLNAIDKKNIKTLPLLVYPMMVSILKILSFINQRPFKTLSEFVHQALKFEIKPSDLGNLIEIVSKGKFYELDELKTITEKIFEQVEKIIEEHGIDPYDADFDPNIPKKSFI